MKVITLGTGAGRPSLTRGASAVSLEYEGSTFLFDCGEGTQLQLMRSSCKWGKIKAIFIGHLHGDHFNGLPGLLGTLSLSDYEGPMKVFGPRGLKALYNTFLNQRVLATRFPIEIIEIDQPGLILNTRRFQVEARALDHTINCWGYVFREKDLPGRFDEAKAKALGLPSGPERGLLVQGQAIRLPDGREIKPEEVVGPRRPGRSMAYCLDTRFCENSILLAQGVDLLVHEATFGEDFKEESSRRGHSTAQEAAEVARQAGVGQLVMTHFSHRYFSVAHLRHEAKKVFPRVELADDLREFTVDLKAD